VRAWHLRNGAAATVITAAGALIGGDATNGLDVDVTRIIPGTTATALGKAEDAAHTSGDTGVMVLAVRQDSQVDFGADGDYVPFSIDDSGQLRVTGGGTQVAADAASGGAGTGTLAMAVRDDALSTLTPVEGDFVFLRTDANGALWVKDNSLAAPGQGTMANSASVAIASDQSTIPTGGTTVVKDVTLSLDTSAYASGDVIADSQQVDAALRITNGTGVLQSVTVIDGDDQGVAFTIYVLSANVALGTENAAPNISDANAANILGIIDVATTDYKDLGGVKVAQIRNLALPIKAVTGTDDIYVGVVNSTGTPTYTASGVVLRLGILQD
jgi:hypothetical protein